jgi:hypothetical protein
MDDDTLKLVPKLKYLGSIFAEDGEKIKNTIKRIKEAKVMVNNKNNYFFRIILVWK